MSMGRQFLRLAYAYKLAMCRQIRVFVPVVFIEVIVRDESHNYLHIYHVMCRLQKVRNSLTRIVLQSGSLTHSEPLLWQLHWLPVHSRMRFKLANITYKALYIFSFISPDW